MLAQTRFQVGGLVLVDDFGLGQLVEHLLYGGVHLQRFLFVGDSAQFTNGITHGLGVISVVQGLLLVLTDSLK